MADLTVFYDDVMPHVPGCPLALAQWAIRQAAIAFCEKSGAHFVDLTAIDSVANVATYALTAPASTRIIKVIECRYEGEDLEPVDGRDLVRKFGSDWEIQSETPTHFVSDTGANVVLVPKPSAGSVGAILPTVELCPTRDAATLDDKYAVPFQDTISLGARAMLFSMPRKSFTDKEKGREDMADFEGKCATARILAQKGRAGAPTRSRDYYYPNR